MTCSDVQRTLKYKNVDVAYAIFHILLHDRPTLVK